MLQEHAHDYRTFIRNALRACVHGEAIAKTIAYIFTAACFGDFKSKVQRN
jgi:hypothetical protein